MISSGVLSLEDDMKFSALVISKHPRSAETFAHRCCSMFCVQKLTFFHWSQLDLTLFLGPFLAFGNIYISFVKCYCLSNNAVT